jgi:FkbM family methyltransferase
MTARWLSREMMFRLGYRPDCLVRDDWRVRYHPTSVDTFRALQQSQEFQQELASFVANCTPDMVIFDIGAHYGAFTLATLHYGGPGARVVAVDPSAETCRVLRINVKLAGGSSRVEVMQAAIGSTDSQLAMLTTGPLGDHFMIVADAPRPDATLIPQYTIASLVQRTGLVPTHIKIDVEGFEGEVVRGGRDVLREHSPTLFFELHGAILRSKNRSPEAVLSDLADCGYTHLEWNGRPTSAAEVAAQGIARIVCRK